MEKKTNYPILTKLSLMGFGIRWFGIRAIPALSCVTKLRGSVSGALTVRKESTGESDLAFCLRGHV